MTVVGYFLDGFKSQQDRIRAQDNSLCSNSRSNNRCREELFAENEVKRSDIYEDGDIETKGVINTFFQDEDLTENKDCFCCTTMQHTFKGTDRQG